MVGTALDKPQVPSTARHALRMAAILVALPTFRQATADKNKCGVQTASFIRVTEILLLRRRAWGWRSLSDHHRLAGVVTLSMSIESTSTPSCLVAASHSSPAPGRRSTWWPAI
jgi:hypothetical protein